jgi:hypothetical protein
MAASRPGAKGLELEDVLRAYFWRAGNFVVRGVPFRVDGEDITDIDLWLYERPSAATRRRLIVDIKNRKSPRASERLIWTKGLQSALGVDGAIVATTDSRASSIRLARTLKVMLLDGDSLSELTQDEELRPSDRLSSVDFDRATKRIDEQRRSSEWRLHVYEAKSSIISGLGVHSANRCLAASAYFAEQAVLAQSGSESANVAVRLLYFTAALASISLDYMVADLTFRPTHERRDSIANSIRYGQSDVGAAGSAIRGALGLVRKYAENGSAVAKQIEYGFFSEADRIPAEMIAEFVTRPLVSDGLFDAARQLSEAAHAVDLPSFDDLPAAGKSILAVFSDFNGISREKLALSWPRSTPARIYQSPTKSADAGPLFKERGRSTISSGSPIKKDE